ncbi:MAG: sugar phosphate nucleotidyltransferase [Gemmatimonadaceae bacterium]
MPFGDVQKGGWEATPSAGAGILPAEDQAREHLLSADAAIWAIVLAGGIGSRFWPLSSPTRPKQLLRLVTELPLIAETVGRLHPVIPAERVLIVTSADIAPAIHAAIPDVPLRNMLVEPRPLGTAAALAWGAQEIFRRAGPNSLLCTLHADLAVAFPEAFRHTMRQAAGLAAREEVMVTIGVNATRAESGFGYLVPGEALSIDAPMSNGGACAVDRFVEKPDAAQAATLIEGGALWHSGIFVARSNVVLDCLRHRTPEISGVLDALAEGDYDRFASGVRSVSLERGLLERCDDLLVVPGDFGWDDVGTWASLKRARELDDDGNGAIGDVHFVESSGNVVHAERSTVAMYGVEGLLVVSLPGITFVTTLEKAAELRPLLDALPDQVRFPQGRAAPESR